MPVRHGGQRAHRSNPCAPRTWVAVRPGHWLSAAAWSILCEPASTASGDPVMKRTKPPFRADMVGSLLRPEPLKRAREQRAAGAIGADALREVEDREIVKVLARQEQIGLQSATDGEFRRSWWHFDFLSRLDGCELVQLDHGIQFHGVQTKAESIAIRGKIGWPQSHPMIGHFKFLEGTHPARPQDDHPEPERPALPGRLQCDQGDLSGHRRILRRRRGRLWQGDPRFLRRRLPLPAARRHGLGLSLRRKPAEAGSRTRRRRRAPPGALRPDHQPRHWKAGPRT